MLILAFAEREFKWLLLSYVEENWGKEEPNGWNDEGF